MVVGTLGSFTTIFVGSFTLQCIKCNGAKFINKIVVNPHKRAWNEANCCSVLRLGEGGGRSVQCTFSARPGKCQKSYTNKIVRNQFGVKFTLSTVIKTHINSNIPIVITGPFLFIFWKKQNTYKDWLSTSKCYKHAFYIYLGSYLKLKQIRSISEELFQLYFLNQKMV